MTTTHPAVFKLTIAKVTIAQQAVDPTSRFCTPARRTKNLELRQPRRFDTLNIIASYDR
jgi:hypothetical protein